MGSYLQRWLLVNHACPVHAELLIGVLVSPSEYEWTAKKKNSFNMKDKDPNKQEKKET